ncbi:MAG TPA: FUSC family protein, partial [Candidatus Baltobacteraceae bacterium]|nr:FUSC family protein [Candidatus Baltobacteraceae bacterium]
MPSTIQRLAASTFRIERRGFDAPFVARCSLGVALALVGGYAVGQPLFAVAGAIGAMSVGFASLQGVYRTRAATMLAMGVTMAFSTVVGMLTAHSPVLTIAALALWGFGYGVFASLGAPAAAVGVNATIALIMFNNYPASGATLWIAATCVMGGSLIQTLLLVVLWPVQRYPLERAALASAYRDLATYARNLDFANPALPPVASMQSVRTTLADPRPFGRNLAIAAFATLLTEAERIRSSLARIATRGSTVYDAQRAAIAQTLDTVASALEDAVAPANDALRTALDVSLDDPVVRGLFGQLRAAWRSAAVPLRGVGLGDTRGWRNVFPNFDESFATLRASLWIDSPSGRHAIRLAIVLSLCAFIAHSFQWQRGYWMTLTAVLVLRPDFTTTISRGIARIAGTVAGVAIATALVIFL